MTGALTDAPDGRLHLNEAGQSPSADVSAALAATARSAHRYPDDTCATLRDVLAEHWNLASDHVAVGAGSSELLVRLARAFVAPTQEIIFATPGFTLHEQIASITGACPVAAALREDCHDLDSMASAVTGRTAAVLICNPHNPTGTVLPTRAIADFVAGLPERVLVVVDEAYIEYADDPSGARPLLDQATNVVVLRTFSKAYGLAGLRVGYALGAPALLARAERQRLPFCVSRAALESAVVALADRASLAEEVARVRACRGWFTDLVRDLGFEVPDSQANFVLIRSPAAVAALVADRCTRRGLLVTIVDDHSIRVSIGHHDALSRLIEELTAMLDHECTDGRPRS